MKDVRILQSCDGKKGFVCAGLCIGARFPVLQICEYKSAVQTAVTPVAV